MAWRLAKSIVRGEIDNRTRGQVTGAIWLAGRTDPVRLSLSGNCLRDIAGCRLTFENPSPEPGDSVGLADMQKGVVGEITASRKVRAFKVPVEEALAMKKDGKPVPEHLCNSLYLEWFSDANGRVVVESGDFRMAVSEPEWSMSEDEEIDQCRANLESIRNWIDRLSDSDPSVEEEDETFDQPRPMDEFEWEKSLKESDKLTEKYSALLEKYVDHPNRDQVVAREMGWTWLDDALDAEERGAFDDVETETDSDDLPLPEPNPLTEGVDWVRTDSGRVTHPLSAKAFDLAIDMWHYCSDKGLLENEGDPDLLEMLFRVQALSAKLAGALDGLAFDEGDVESGFVVACLKRALRSFDATIAAGTLVEKKKILDADRMESFREALFSIREEVLRLMKRFREKPSGGTT